MKRQSIAVLCCLLVISFTVTPASGQLIFRKAFQTKYGFKSVSCYTCHARGKDESGKILGKEHRNAFGKEIAKLLEGKDVTERITEAKKLDADAKQKEYDAVTKDFLEAVSKVEKVKSPEGPTWGEMIKEAKLDGVKK